MKHKHAELIIAWANGAIIQVNLNGQWIDCLGGPCWNNFLEYRIKPPGVPQWRKNLAQALKDGKEVQFYSSHYENWLKTTWSAKNFLDADFYLANEKYKFRIKPEPKPKPYSWRGVATIPEDAVFINPHTKRPRDARDVFSDPYGLLITDVKPEPKPDKFTYLHQSSVSTGHWYETERISFISELKLIWDGETGALKGAEVLS